MRQIILDTETTGLDPSAGHKIIEIGCVELQDRRATGNNYHQYLQPDREMDQGALEVHGISNAFLQDKPRFADIAADFLAYIDGAQLVIHNAAFDVGFLDMELSLWQAGENIGRHCQVLDTLVLARQLHPGKRNNLDALCKRYAIDNSQRTLHGALLDAEILADVYLAMTGGQSSLKLETPSAAKPAYTPTSEYQPTVIIRANAEELALHQQMRERIHKANGNSIWQQLETGFIEEAPPEPEQPAALIDLDELFAADDLPEPENPFDADYFPQNPEDEAPF